jgi:hypothetical protein
MAGDEIDLSPAARQLLHDTGPGKSANAPAHRALAAVAENEELAKLPFGKVVSAISHGTLETLLAARPAPSISDELAAGAESVDPGILPDEHDSPVIDDAPFIESASDAVVADTVVGTSTAAFDELTDPEIANTSAPQA